MAVTVENGACTGWGRLIVLVIVLVSRDALETRRRSHVHSVYGLMHAATVSKPRGFPKPQDNVVQVFDTPQVVNCFMVESDAKIMPCALTFVLMNCKIASICSTVIARIAKLLLFLALCISCDIVYIRSHLGVSGSAWRETRVVE